MSLYPDMINRLEPGVVAAFGRTLDLIGQQTQSDLVNHVQADLNYSDSGDRFTDELAGKLESQEVFSDWSDTPDNHLDQQRRFAFYRTWSTDTWVGKRELAEKLVNPTNANTMAMAAAKVRRRDERIMALFHDASNEVPMGGDGAVSAVAFPASQVVAVNEQKFFKGKVDGAGAPSPAVTTLTPAKIREARRVLSLGQIRSSSNPKIAVEQEDLENMATSLEVTSRDYITAMALADGQASTGFGFDWVRVESGVLRRNGSNQAIIPVWLKEQIHYRERQLVPTRIGERADKRYRWQAYHEWQTTGLRRQDKAVVHILAAR